MPVPIGDTLGIFADNTRLRKSVLPISKKRVTSWAKGLNMPATGETVLYTGQMYQLVPLIDSMSLRLGKLENSWITNYFGAGRAVNKIFNLSGFMARSDPAKERAFNEPLRNIARLLKMAGLEFGYLYEKDLYSGALVYDEGLDDAFARHANLIYRMFKDSNIKRVITADPHTTNILRSVYPRFVTGFDIQVKSYLEILAENEFKITKPVEAEVTIHDSCIYARHEGVIDQPRLLLRKAGVRIQEAELSGKLTHCCGGPLESLFPSKATEIAAKRIEQLADCAKQIVTSCPICLANLRRVAPADVVIRDISEFLVEAFCPNPWKEAVR
jgi:Fe-S oxidoreductase